MAAHITAASPGTPDKLAPRYDNSLSASERSDISNGIWLCQNCAKLIDSDIPRFPADLLRRWKKEAEERALLALATSANHLGLGFAELDEDDREFLRALALSEDEDVEVVTGRLKHAARNDLAAFRGTRDWPPHVVELDLILNVNGKRNAVSLAGIASATGVVDRLSIISPPGTGKTTTVIQLADKIIDVGQAVPLLVPLGEWSGSGEGLLEFVARRNAFRNFRRQHFQLLGFYGRLVLLVDGWNEADGVSRMHAIRELKALSRDFPLLSTLIATRQQGVPTSGPIIEIALLNEEQQLEIARHFPGGNREEVVDRAWRIPGIGELIATPLYLNALLNCAQEGSFPQTKEEVLSTFVAQHESAPDKAEALRNYLFDCHKHLLVGLAVEANQLGSTTIPDENARRAINQAGAQLTSKGQMAACPQPAIVLDVLVNTHALVRARNGSVSFQHQQFQEWYASFEVERLMLNAARSDAEAKGRLRTRILNWLPWEESILFACERLSRKDVDGAQAVGAAILEALGVDPMLAAEMVFRSTDIVWAQIKDKIIGFVGRWHKPGLVDRAVRFMITTGRPEFAPQIWPLVASPNPQVYLIALRKAERFRPSVLGADAAKRLSELPENIRGNIVAAMTDESGFDGLELATRIAKTDPRAEVVVEIIRALAFRRADRHVCEILNTASETVWIRLVTAGYGINLIEPSQKVRLADLRAAQDVQQTNPVCAVVRLAEHSPPEDTIGERIAKTVEANSFPGNSEQGAFAIKQAFARYPDHTRRALLNRIQTGLPVPYGVEDLLKGIPAVDEGPLATAVLDKSAPEPLARFAPVVIGPLTIGKVIDRLFVLDDKRQAADGRVDEPTRDEFWRLKGVLAATRQVPFIQALLKRAESDTPHRIQLMADLLASHGAGEQEMHPLREDLRHTLTETMERWINTLLASQEANRHQLAAVARTVERLPQRQFAGALARMLERDLADWERARDDLRKSPRRGPIGLDVTMSYTLQYQRAFAAIGGAEVVALMKRYLPDKRFGVDAALVLSAISSRASGLLNDTRLAGWNNFANVKKNRLIRQDTQSPPPSSDSAEAIFAVVRELGTDKSDSASQQHAIQLATVALRTARGFKRAEIDALIGLPLPFSDKRRLLAAAAEAGEILRVQDLIGGVKELVELAKKEPWRLDKNTGELMGWISLFPFSDRPAAVIEILDAVPRQYCEPWDLDRLLIALADSPHEEILLVFKALADRDARILSNHYWLHSLLKLGTEAAAALTIDLICDGRLPAPDGFPERQFADLVRRYPKIRLLLLQRYAMMAPGRQQATLESILLEIADADIVLALVRSYARNKRKFNGNLAHAIRQTAIGRRPAPDWPNAYYEFSVTLADLRKQLFAMVLSNNSESALAFACLNEIEELRDERGRVNDEPRHPDIDSAQPWPLEQAYADRVTVHLS